MADDLPNQQTIDEDYTIKVYRNDKVKKDWQDSDSEDDFRIEPTNVGDYLQRQQELHDAIQNRFDE